MSLYELFVKLSADTRDFKGPMKDAQTQMGTFGTGAAKLAAQLGTGIGLAAIGAAATAAAHKFDTAFAQIARSTGATGEKLEGLSKSFVEVYKSTSASAESVTTALSNIATRTGATGKALEELTLQMIRLAKTQKEDVGALTPLVTRVFGDWSIATYDQAGALKYLQAVSQQAGTSVSRLSETVVYAGAPLRMLGYDFETATALIGKFEKEGVNTELVLGGMKAALQKFAKEGVKDVNAEWDKFVAGVKNGSVTLSDALKLVGAKRGPDLYRAIVEGRFEVEKMTASAKELADKGGASIETFTGQLTKLQHRLESVVANHKDLVMTAPMVVMALGTIATGITALIPLLAKAASGTAVLFSAGAIAAIWATSEALSDLDRKYESLANRQKGREPLVPWTAEEGKGFSAGLGFTMAKAPVVSAPDAKALAEYAKVLEKAMELFGLNSKKVGELRDGINLLSKEYIAGRLTIDQYTEAGTKYREELDKIRGIVERGTMGEIALAGAHVTHEEAVKRLTTAVQAMQDASKPWGAQLEYQRAALDNLTTSMYAAWTAMQAGATTQLSVDWSKASKGTTLETAMDPNSSVALRRQADAAAQEALRKRDMWQQGKATQEDYMRAQAAATEAENKATGATKQHTAAISGQRTAAQEVDREVRRAFDNMARQMSKSIMEWKGWGEGLKNVAKDLAGGMLEIFIRGLFKPLENQIAKLAGKLADAISGAIGGGASAAGGAASGAASIGGGAASGVSGVAGNMATAWVGAISSAVSAVSGVISNFQFAAMNKSLDLIEHETRYTQIHTLNILEKLNEYIPNLKDLMGYMWETQEPYLRQINDGIQSWIKTVTVNAFPVFQPQMVSAPTGDIITESRGGDTFYIDGINSGGVNSDAMAMFKEGARILRARGVRGTPGIR